MGSVWREQPHVFIALKTKPVSLFCSIRVVVEDKESSGGAFSMKVSPTATVERLQQEVTALSKSLCFCSFLNGNINILKHCCSSCVIFGVNVFLKRTVASGQPEWKSSSKSS